MLFLFVKKIYLKLRSVYIMSSNNSEKKKVTYHLNVITIKDGFFIVI